MAENYVYFFSAGDSDGDASMRQILGGKGANLAEMCRIGIPVPPGFTIATTVCDYYYKHDKAYPPELWGQVEEKLGKLERAMGKKFGDTKDPLLVSVRSGAAASMPGMMDTVLNLGLNEESVRGIIEKTGNERFGWDAYRRFIHMFGDVVMGVHHEHFEAAIQLKKAEADVKMDTDLTAQDLKELVANYKKIYKEHTGEDFPSDPMEQLRKSIDAVFGSWNTPRAVKYRELNDIKGLLGTAVNVQAMVFGNMGENCGTGVAFTRNPSSGENKFYGEYLMNAQGEDVVAGIRTPHPIADLEKEMPGIYAQLLEIRETLEKHYKDMQDVEFTIQDGKLWMLQTRNGKRTIFGALRIAVEMVEEGLIDRKTAMMRVDAEQLNQLFAPILDHSDVSRAEVEGEDLACGLPASPGGATGKLVFSSEHAEEVVNKAKAEAEKLPKREREEYLRKHGQVILTRIETTPEDIGGMAVAEGILTARGGMTSHAAVVARGMGVPCVAGAEKVVIDYSTRTLNIGDRKFKEGDSISIDGFAGKVYGRPITVKPSEILQVLGGEMAPDDSLLFRQYHKFMGWADEIRVMGVRTNADTPKDTTVAVNFGAQGIGLCRTEHMFFEADRIIAFRRMILAKDEEARREALTKILPLQRDDFEGIFRALAGRPATIRFLDPPLHEFLPHDEAGQKQVAEQLGVEVSVIREKVHSLAETNPMLGHRGCRLGISYPEISEMQTRAVIEAAVKVKKEGIEVHPEIMIPLVGEIKELALQKAVVIETAETVLAEAGMTRDDIPYTIGTMIEIPRAAVTADEIAEEADFFSFGTNDLTQMGCGFSRDDAGKFLPEYVRLGIYEKDPFQVLDQRGVGKLVKIACELGRKANPNLKLGICGEHGGEPSSVKFCHRTGLNYVSCSPYRVPVARLAAAQAQIDTPR